MKEDVKKFIADLLNHTSIDPKTYPLQWLTRALVTPKDLPWYVAGEDAKALEDVGFRQGLEPVTTIPPRPSTKKRHRQADEYTNGYPNSSETPADFSINDGHDRANDEE